MHAHGIAQFDGTRKGIHLLWMGPHAWVYSLRGWSIQRRRWRETDQEQVCEGLEGSSIAAMRVEHERELSFGILTFHEGSAPVSIQGAQPQGSHFLGTTQPCDVFRLELHEPQDWVSVEVSAKASLTYALRDGKTVAIGGPSTGLGAHVLSALGIDTVVVWTLGLVWIRFCLRAPRKDADDWSDVPFIAKGLQLPIRELMPSLSNGADELAEAERRLLPGETLEASEFQRLSQTLRTGVTAHGTLRPIDQVLLLRENTTQSFEELVWLDPLRVLLAHPKWRRVLGFGFFDDDPELVPGETYEYRITGHFPKGDLIDRVYGFHTVPSQTLLPATFFIEGLRIDLPQPARVELAPEPPASGHRHTARRGVRLTPEDEPFWLLPSLHGWSAVLHFPSPLTSVVLELAPGHSLDFDSLALFGPLAPRAPVPAGASPRLHFAQPTTQIRLTGRGVLFAVRIRVGGGGVVPVSAVLPPVRFVDAPRPEPPLSVALSNLQIPQPVPTDDQPPADLAHRHALGFEVRWRPALLGGLALWPQDAEAPPPIEAALFRIEHGQASSGSWEPLLPEENWTLGDRDREPSDTQIRPGVDLMSAFPERARGSWSGGLDLLWRDVFDFEQGDNVVRRPAPEPGTLHRYRVWAVDAAGRPSLAPTLSTQRRLEKHVPPPLPVGPSTAPASATPLPEPTGVHARVLVVGAPDLTAADAGTLGADGNAVVLRWGWHAEQREQDPWAREFRVYVADEPLDQVEANLTSVTPVADGVYQVTLSLGRNVAADAAKDAFLEAGYSFLVKTHTAGNVVTATLETKIKKEDGSYHEPRPGPVTFPLRLTPDKTRPPAWTQRVEVQPITAATQYEATLRNRLTLTAEHPRDVIWVGVSSADDQSYVSDQLAPAQTRPGNESAIVPVVCAGRYHGRPTYDVPPPLDPVPAVRAPEPSGRPVYFDLDLSSALAYAGLSPGDRVQIYRASADSILGAYYVSDDGRIMASVVDALEPSEVDTEVAVGNPDDRTAVIDGVNAADRRVMADRYVVFLAGSHPYRDRLFEKVEDEPRSLGPFKETLPPEPGRYVYFVRRANAAGHLSAGGAMAKMVLRLPSMAPGAAPERRTDPPPPPGTLTLIVPADFELTHVLVFSQVVADGHGPPRTPSLMRVPNRPDLYPANGIRLRAPNGAILAPQVKALADADVAADLDGTLVVQLGLSAPAGERLRAWACTLTRDGIPSRLGGGWSLPMPLGPLPSPTLTVAGGRDAPTFSWSWPGSDSHDVALQASADGLSWKRISPILVRGTTSFAPRSTAAGPQFRLMVTTVDGRTATSNVVTP